MSSRIMAWQAIETRFFGATARRGRRLRVRTQAGTRWYSWDELDAGLGEVPEVHAAGARRFATEWGWDWPMTIGANAAGDGYVFVFVNAASEVK